MDIQKFILQIIEKKGVNYKKVSDTVSKISATVSNKDKSGVTTTKKLEIIVRKISEKNYSISIMFNNVEISKGDAEQLGIVGDLEKYISSFAQKEQQQTEQQLQDILDLIV